MLPESPVILLSFVNTKLRDGCADIESFCAQYNVKLEEITDKLDGIGYVYDRTLNRYIGKE